MPRGGGGKTRGQVGPQPFGRNPILSRNHLHAKKSENWQNVRRFGYCPRCCAWRPPAAAAPGLEETASYSPAGQDRAALLAGKRPVEGARAVLAHLTGVKLPRATLDRATLRRRGQEPERWHWVYPGTCFRLDHRGQTAGGRPVIVQRGYVATRAGLDALREQMHGEALRRGLGPAASVLVIGDGAVWLWRLADDRWPQARQRLDF